jgi:1-acyl-sn-glycerol-3-phosphate acyltransferase
MLRRALIAGFRQVVRLYFRQIERAGTAPGPATRGRVVVSNHQNALIDPLLVMTDAAAELAPVAKSTLWKIRGLRFLLDAVGAVPILRRQDDPTKQASANDDTFDAIATHLSTGGNLLIFPEGTSHSGPHLAPLRSGAARMLEHAASRAPGEPLTFQAAALEFDEPDRFRSRCLILWGPVRRLDEVPGAGEARIANVTALMQADLAELLVEGKTHDERLLVARVAELLAHTAGDTTLEAWSSIGRRVELAHATLQRLDADRIDRVRRRVDEYHAALARLGLHDADVVDGIAGGDRTTHRLRLALLAPLAIPGMILYAIPYFIPRRVARTADLDAVSTYKVAAGLLVYPIWMGGLITASIALLPPGWKLPGVAVSILSPFAALAFLDAWDARRRPVSAADLERIVELRAAAMWEIEDARTTAAVG